MSKGTKQIRFGKVQKVIEEMELLIRVYKMEKEITPSEESKLILFGKIQALEIVKHDLEELGR
jgi:hypothetical protein